VTNRENVLNTDLQELFGAPKAWAHGGVAGGPLHADAELGDLSAQQVPCRVSERVCDDSEPIRQPGLELFGCGLR